MANYVVTTRNKDGSLAERSYTANDRAELFQKLAADGVAAVRVSEGATVKKPRKAVKKAGAPAKGRGLLAAAIVVILVAFAVALFSFMGDKGNVAGVEEVDKPKDVKTDFKKAEESHAAQSEDMALVKRRAGDKVREKKENRAKSSDIGEDNSTETVSEPTPKPRRIFKHGTDQLIWLAVFASNGASIPPLPNMSVEDTDRFIASLKKPIEISPDDPEQIQDMKKKVDEVRAQIAEILDKNPNAELVDVLNDHRREYNGQLNLYADAKKGYDELIAAGDAEGAEVFRKAANEMLSQYGSNTIEVESETEEENN